MAGSPSSANKVTKRGGKPAPAKAELIPPNSVFNCPALALGNPGIGLVGTVVKNGTELT